MVDEVSTYVRGWRSYYGFCQTPTVLQGLDSWIRRRLRSVIAYQGRRGQRLGATLYRRGVPRPIAAGAAKWSAGPWRKSRDRAFATAFSNAFFDSLGLSRLTPRLRAQPDRTAVYGPVRAVVWEG